MKIELRIEADHPGEMTRAVLFLARQLLTDTAPVVAEEATVEPAPAAEAEPEPAPAEKPKRTRRAAEPAPQPEPAPNITATPEAREPAVEPEPAKEITADDIRTALNAIVAKFGMPYATSNVQRLLGAPKVGAVEPATYPEVLARLEAELAVEDING